MKKTFLMLAILACGKGAWANTQGYVLLSSRWDKTDIPVCWEHAGNDTEKDWVRQAVAGSWSAVSAVRFTGWGLCPQPAVIYHLSYGNNRGATAQAPTVTFPGIRILIKDGGPHTKGLGNRIAGVVDGMMLNFTYNNWGNGAIANTLDCRTTRRRECIEDNAIHEFGHALGIAHEQNRPDTPPSCEDDQQGTNGNALIGTWDPNSVMNYCNHGLNLALSSGDMETVNFLYPFKLGPPRNPSPADIGQVFSSRANLKWDAADPYFSENITYDVYFGTTNPPTVKVASNLTGTAFSMAGLPVKTEFFWRVNVRRTQTYVRESGFSGILWTDLFATYSADQTTTTMDTKGPVWRFETNPNLTPVISMLLL